MYLTQVPDFTGFNDPVKGKEAALALYGQGADVIFHAAGGDLESLTIVAAILPGVAAILVDAAKYPLPQLRIEMEQPSELRLEPLAKVEVDKSLPINDPAMLEWHPPIPRTAAMLVYGDLDVSVLDEMPPGRTPIVTRWAEGALLEAGFEKAKEKRDK